MTSESNQTMSEKSLVLRENRDQEIPDNFPFLLIYSDTDTDTDTPRTNLLGGRTCDENIKLNFLLFRTDLGARERIRNAFSTNDSQVSDLDNFLLTEVDLGSLTIVQQDCCLFIFLDGSAHYLDDFMRDKTGEYQLQPGRINGFPHYAR